MKKFFLVAILLTVSTLSADQIVTMVNDTNSEVHLKYGLSIIDTTPLVLKPHSTVNLKKMPLVIKWESQYHVWSEVDYPLSPQGGNAAKVTIRFYQSGNKIAIAIE